MNKRSLKIGYMKQLQNRRMQGTADGNTEAIKEELKKKGFSADQINMWLNQATGFAGGVIALLTQLGVIKNNQIQSASTYTPPPYNPSSNNNLLYIGIGVAVLLGAFIIMKD